MKSKRSEFFNFLGNKQKKIKNNLDFIKAANCQTHRMRQNMNKRKSFTALLENHVDNMDAAFVAVPFDVQAEYGTKGHVKVKAWFDGYPYRGILANMGTGNHVIIVRKDIRQSIGKKVGEKIEVELELDTDERIVEVPEDLKKALNLSGKALAFFNSLSYTNKKEYCVWVSSAKKTETRQKRLSKAVNKLLSGKKNPTQK